MKDIRKQYTRQIMIDGEKFMVDTNREIPPKGAGKTTLKELATKMNHGDSIAFDKYSTANSLGQHLKKSGKKYVCRKDGKKFRVWKIDPEEEN